MKSVVEDLLSVFGAIVVTALVLALSAKTVDALKSAGGTLCEMVTTGTAIVVLPPVS